MPRLIVNIEQRHIDNGWPRFTDQCPVALALNEQHPGYGRWLVKINSVTRWPGRPVRLPKRAEKFCLDFYNGEPVQPFSFELEV